MNLVSATPWTSALSATTPNDIRIRGYNLLDLIGNISFTSTLYLLYTGELPSTRAGELLDALMVAAIDHGPGTPSVLAARTVISGGAAFQAGAAAGLLTMGDYHAAAVGDCMTTVLEIAASENVEEAAKAAVMAHRAEGRRLPGFGHRQHTERDPRVDKLFTMAHEREVDGRFIHATITIEAALEEVTGRKLPINIDGVYAAILAEISFPQDYANAVFIASRMTGVMAHVAEELSRMSPMRRIDPIAHSYDGPPNRTLPERSFS